MKSMISKSVLVGILLTGLGSSAEETKPVLGLAETGMNSNTCTEFFSNERSAVPVLRKDKKMIFLNLLNLNKESVYVKITDNMGRVVFEEVISDTMVVERAFNFKRAFSGNYTVIVKNNSNTYYERIFIS